MSSQQQQEQPAVVITSGKQPYLYEERYRPCFVWTLILAPCLMPAVWEYHVTITDTELSFGYAMGCVECHVDRSMIRTVEVIPKINAWCDWGGLGIRKQLPSWETGYIAKAVGPGVRMTMVVVDENDTNTDGKELAYTFSCNDPETVVTLLTGEAPEAAE